jgi:hypothetical protein
MNGSREFGRGGGEASAIFIVKRLPRNGGNVSISFAGWSWTESNRLNIYFALSISASEASNRLRHSPAADFLMAVCKVLIAAF